MSNADNNIPAAIDGHTYVWHDDVDGATNPLHGVLLVRVDSRRAGSGYTHRYAPIALDTASGVDTGAAFWDEWDEVQSVRG